MGYIRVLRSLTERTLALVAALVFGSSALLLTACNTTEGAGKDIEATGEAIQDAAD